MSYEVYIDVFFAVNTVLDIPILILVRKIQHYRSSVVRIVLASMAGAGILSLMLCLKARTYVLIRAVAYVCAYGTMGAVAFPDRKGTERIRTAVAVYITGILFNGVFRWLSLKIEHLPGVLAGCLLVYAVVSGIMALYKRLQGKEHEIYEVRVRYHGRDIIMKGLWDTGNRLRSPYHGRGISVVSYEMVSGCMDSRLKLLMERGEMPQEYAAGEPVYYVPFETVNHTGGMLPVIEAERLYIMKDNGMVEYRKPLLGVSMVPVSSSRTFQIILTTDG